MFPVSGRLNLASSMGTLSSTLAALVCSVQLTEVSRLVTVSNCELCLWACNYNEHDFYKILSINTDLVACDSDSETRFLGIRSVEKERTFPIYRGFDIIADKGHNLLSKNLSTILILLSLKFQ